MLKLQKKPESMNVLKQQTDRSECAENTDTRECECAETTDTGVNVLKVQTHGSECAETTDTQQSVNVLRIHTQE